MSENPRKIALFLPLPHGLTQLGVVLVITCDKCRLFYNTQKLSTKVGQRVASSSSSSTYHRRPHTTNPPHITDYTYHGPHIPMTKHTTYLTYHVSHIASRTTYLMSHLTPIQLTKYITLNNVQVKHTTKVLLSPN